VDFDTIDVFEVDDIFNVGGKQPIFSQFGFEDWALMSLRFELNLLVHAFRKDVKDEERKGIHEDNIGFYYNKYFKKLMSPAYFGVKNQQELLRFFSETLMVTDKKILDTFLPGDFETLNIFVLLAEESRRDRQLRTDLGEKDAKINMQTSSISAVMPQFGGAQRPSFLPAIRPQFASVAAAAQAFGGRPAMVGPGQQWPQQQQQQPWRPAAPAGAWGAPRPAGAWGAPQVRPAYGMGMMPRPMGMMPRPAWGVGR